MWLRISRVSDLGKQHLILAGHGVAVALASLLETRRVLTPELQTAELGCVKVTEFDRKRIPQAEETLFLFT